jgi:hypothetical protein
MTAKQNLQKQNGIEEKMEEADAKREVQMLIWSLRLKVS